jgi:putative hydrolase of the HAD superfamily
MSVRAVLLDALGTVLRLDDPVGRLRAELAGRGVSVTTDEAREALRAEMTYYRKHHDEARDAARLDDLRHRCALVLNAALPPHARGLPDIRDALMSSLRFTAFPEVPEVLRELRGRGLKLVVVSNWDVSLHDALTAAGVAPLVDAAVSSAEAGARKPHARIFIHALVLAGGVAASDALHAGDTLEADVDGARAMGIAPVFVARDGEPGPPGVPTIADLRGLATYLE